MFNDTLIARNLIHPVTAAAAMEETCNGCGICKKECAFLDTYGNPGAIAKNIRKDPDKWLSASFECSLCGLCTSVCPRNLDPAALFLDFRRQANETGRADLSPYKVLLTYEMRGTSRRYSLYHLPDACDTVFFPGCTLAGTRAATTLKTYEYLKTLVPSLGIVLDCCTKPSHDLGRQDYFERMFSGMTSRLGEKGVKTVLVACPNCHKIFTTHGRRFTVETVYEVLARNGMPDAGTQPCSIIVHDPCPVRFETGVQASVRSLARARGLTILDTPHQEEKTFCCGEGGAVACVSPGFAREWTRKRTGEAHPHKIMSYCTGCVTLLSKKTASFHVLDLVFDPEAALAGKARVSRAPFTYLNRLRLKHKLKKRPAGCIEERPGIARREKQKTLGFKLVFAGLILAIMAGVRASGILDDFNPEQLSLIIQDSGAMAPAIYMLIYALAPALFLPGLPITLAGGILFGPFWGVVYSITGATTGAGIAFLISRYISSGFVRSKVAGPRWRRLQDNVETHGWKVVALTRLIPLFPFNLLNYAFGLTRIKFSHYIIATFICMLPACIAFIVFSSSLLDLVQGKFSWAFVLGLALIVLVSLFPVFYNRIKNKGK